MYKCKKTKFNSILAAGIIVCLVGGVQFRTHAATPDQLYANAFNATANAVSAHTQKSINDARASIELLRNTPASWAIGEFSKQVDQVQHPILVNIVDSINKAQQSKKQADINAAKAAIDPALPAVWRNSYSSAVDTIQQGLMKDLIDAYNQAALKDTSNDINNAMSLLQDIKLSSDPSIAAWAVQYTGPMVTVWTNTDVINIENNMTKDAANLASYSISKLEYVNGEVSVFKDSNKNIRFAYLIKSDSNVERGYYFLNNNISNIYEKSGDQTTQYQDTVYLKDNKVIAWVTITLTNNEVTKVKVYDNSNLPADWNSELAVMMQDANSIITDAAN